MTEPPPEFLNSENRSAEEPVAERRRLSPFAVMAASLAGAAAAGAMLGAIVVTGLARPTPVATGPKFGIEEVNALKEQVVQARVELAALKSNLDAGHRSANQQLTRITERVERMERTQAEPVAKLTKAVEVARTRASRRDRGRAERRGDRLDHAAERRQARRRRRLDPARCSPRYGFHRRPHGDH